MRNIFQRTSPRAETSQWYMIVVSGYIVRKCSVAVGSHHKTLGGDICKWNRNLCYISKRITFADRCRICSSPVSFVYSWESQSITAATGQTDLGKGAQLISSPYENLVNIRNSNLIELYSDSITELCKKCNISLAISCKRRKLKQLEEFMF